MTVTGHILETEPIDIDLSMIIVGEKKAGKSELASTAPAPVLFFDFDLRSGALKKKKDVYALSFQDPPDSKNLQPTAMNELLTILGQLEKTRELRVLHENFKNLPPGLMVKTVVFDSVETIAKSARNYVMYGNNEISKAFSIQGRTYRVPNSWHAWGGEESMVMSAILQAIAIPGLNVIVILHECPEEDERSTEDNPIFTGKIEVFPRRYNKHLVYFNEVWRVIRTSGRIPKVQIDPDGKFMLASTALPGIEKVEFPNITAVLEQAKLRR